MAYDEERLKTLEAENKSGLYTPEVYKEMKKEIMGDDYKDDSAPVSSPQASAPVSTPAQSSALPMMNTSTPAFKIPKYSVRVDNKESGPFERDVIFKMIQNGDIDRDTLVWNENFDEWKIAENVPELEERFPAAPPPGSKADKRRKDIEQAKLRAEQQARDEARRKTEEQQRAAERQRAEEQRKADEQKRERERVIADEQRKITEQRQAEERRRAEEQRRLDEEARRKAAAYSPSSSSSSSYSSTPSYSSTTPARTSTPSYSSYSYGPDAEDVLSVVNGVIIGLVGGVIVLAILAGGFEWNIILSVILSLGAAVGIFFLVKLVFFEEHPIITNIVSAVIVVIAVLAIIGTVRSNSGKSENTVVEEQSAAHPPIVATGVVTGVTSLNLREGPSTNHNVITSLKEGSIVNITGDAVGTWLPVYILYDDGTSYEGYVGSGYIKIRE